MTKLDAPPREVVEAMVLMLAPVAPHIAEEMWQRLGHDDGVAYAAFPVSDPAKIVQEQVTCVIQIKGKVRDRVEVSPDISEDDLRELALGRDKVEGGDRGRHPHGHRPGAEARQRRPAVVPLTDRRRKERDVSTTDRHRLDGLPARERSSSAHGIEVVPLHVVVGGQGLRRGAGHLGGAGRGCAARVHHRHHVAADAAGLRRDVPASGRRGRDGHRLGPPVVADVGHGRGSPARSG